VFVISVPKICSTSCCTPYFKFYGCTHKIKKRETIWLHRTTVKLEKSFMHDFQLVFTVTNSIRKVSRLDVFQMSRTQRKNPKIIRNVLVHLHEQR
jgi:hypothetical protein